MTPLGPDEWGGRYGDVVFRSSPNGSTARVVVSCQNPNAAPGQHMRVRAVHCNSLVAWKRLRRTVFKDCGRYGTTPQFDGRSPLAESKPTQRARRRAELGLPPRPPAPVPEVRPIDPVEAANQRLLASFGFHGDE